MAACSLLAVTACGDAQEPATREVQVNSESPDAESQDSESQSPGPTRYSQVPPPIMTPPTAPPTVPTDTFTKVSVVGVVTALTDVGCVEVLDDNGVRWALVGDVELPPVGARVKATGMPMPEGYGGCVGAPVKVSEVSVVDR